MAPKILIADDEPDIRDVLKITLSEENYTILEAGDGEEALKIITTKPLDLVLLDYKMPKMDGREVCRRLKDDPATRDIKVVVMTSAYMAGKYKSEALHTFHADEYLFKPLGFKTLRSVLQRLLD